MSTVLVIDDRVTNRQVLSRLADQADEEAVVHTFADPREAIAWSTENTPDLVVTDFKMPGMDGAEFTRLFRAQPLCYDVPVIVVTIYEEKSYRYRALEAGATDFLISPVDHQEFQARIRNLLRIRRQQRVIQRRTRSLERRLVDDNITHEVQLRETREVLRQVLDTVPALVNATDPQGRIVFANSAFAEANRRTTANIVSCNLAELLDAHDADRHAALDRRVLDGDESHLAFEEEFAQPDGEMRTYLTVKSPLMDVEKNISAVVTASLDITDRKQIELVAQRQQNHLRVIVDNIPNWVYATDEHHRFTLVNLAMARAFGTAPDEMIGKTFADYIRDAEQARLDQRGDEEVLRTGQPSVRAETSRLDVFGERQWMQTTKVPFVSSTGDIEVLNVTTDFSERRRAEEVLRAAKEEAEAANRNKTEFLANLSHELRTPLNHIMGFSEMMSDEVYGDFGDERYREYAAAIHESGTHLLAILDDILDVSKLETGNHKLVERNVDINKVATSVIKLVAERAQQAGLELTAGLEVGLQEVFADERMVRQMLLNLLSNALKFTPEGGKVCVETRVGPDGDFRLSVSDNGVGIAESDFKTVLAPFGQAENSMSRNHQGTGLGLALVKSMIELHDGVLLLESELDVGTTITLCFPAKRGVSLEMAPVVDLRA